MRNERVQARGEGQMNASWDIARRKERARAQRRLPAVHNTPTHTTRIKNVPAVHTLRVRFELFTGKIINVRSTLRRHSVLPKLESDHEQLLTSPIPVKRHRGSRDTRGTRITPTWRRTSQPSPPTHNPHVSANTGEKTPGGAGTHTGHTYRYLCPGSPRCL